MEGPAPAVIDCHALAVSSDRALYPFAPDADPPAAGEFETCTDSQALAAAMSAGAVSGAVLVQRNRFYGDDNSLILDLAAGNPALRAICSVGSGGTDSGSIARALLERERVAGFRLMEPHKGAGLDWLAGTNARQVWRAAAETGAIMDVHVFPWNRDEGLARLRLLLDEFGDVPVLLDNLGNGPIEQGPPDYGFDRVLATVAEAPNLTMKFSEMTLGRIDRAGFDPAEAIARLAALTGVERLLWGSDLLPPGRTLADAAERARAATGLLAEAVRRAILSGNAARLFGFRSDT